MGKVIELETQRLKLRQWCKSDLPLFATMNADPQVMAYYPNTLSGTESNTMANKLKSLIVERTWGFWAVEIKTNKTFIGFVGLHQPTFDLPVTPCVEIAWRLGKEHWGRGYATEAAHAALNFAFDVLTLNEVYSFTSVANEKSSAVMERLNMQNMKSNFEHPIIPENHPLREHVLYKMTAEQWRNNAV